MHSMFSAEGNEIVTHYANAMGHMADRVKAAIESSTLTDAQAERIMERLVEGVEEALRTLADTEPNCGEATDTAVVDSVIAHCGL